MGGGGGKQVLASGWVVNLKESIEPGPWGGGINREGKGPGTIAISER